MTVASLLIPGLPSHVHILGQPISTLTAQGQPLVPPHPFKLVGHTWWHLSMVSGPGSGKLNSPCVCEQNDTILLPFVWSQEDFGE